MNFPSPEPGLVVRYSYLWHSEYAAGREEGSKDRPAAIVLLTREEDGRDVVTVLLITHLAPTQPEFAVEIPSVTKRRLGLDSERSWVVLSEANRFVWPGPDLRAAPGKDISTIAYGLLPPDFFRVIRQKYLAIARASLSRIVQRTE